MNVNVANSIKLRARLDRRAIYAFPDMGIQKV